MTFDDYVLLKTYLFCIRGKFCYLYTKKRLRFLLAQALPRITLYQPTCLMQHLKSATTPKGGALRG
ncbi:hypothetical protein NIES3275_43900 [Microchaete diplosiphon NIES-3275]|nr:hypothetical protein NIES3275_43900 [Microchaete diplosiphon NIES-3275]